MKLTSNIQETIVLMNKLSYIKVVYYEEYDVPLAHGEMTNCELSK